MISTNVFNTRDSAEHERRLRIEIWICTKGKRMGYDVHITRKSNWYDEEGPTISLEEWSRYVAGDPEMRADGFAEAIDPDGSVTIRIEHPGIAVWVSYSGHGAGGNMAWFCHLDDKIVVKNPDREIIAKMHLIASPLGAKVQGDEGEEYDANGEPTPAPEPMTMRRWWHFWKRDSR